MGWFSGSSKTYVSSTVYNLAEDADLQLAVFPTVLSGLILSNSKESISDALNRTLIGGTGMKQRMFHTATALEFPESLPKAIIGGAITVDSAAIQSTLEGLIGLSTGQTLRLLSAVIDYADIDHWARVWVKTTYPDATESQWSADWDNLNKEIRVDVSALNPAAPIHVIPAPAHLTWAMANPTAFRRLLLCTYQIVSAPDATGQIEVSPPALFTYRMGTGNAVLDGLLDSRDSIDAEFLPVLPLRLSNVPIDDPTYASLFPKVSAAFHKLTDGKIEDLLAAIEDNENIDDVDFCFLVQGVSLNTRDRDGLRYLYAFFQSLMSAQKASKTDFEAYRAARLGKLQSNVSWDRWMKQHKKGSSNFGAPPPAPAVLAMSEPTISELRLTTEASPSFDYRIRWVYAAEEQFAGNAKTHDGDTSRGTLAAGQYWAMAAPPIVLPAIPRADASDRSWATSAYDAKTYDRIWLFHQHSTYGYSRIEVLGLQHQNYVYGSHAVTLKGSQALAETDISGFLVPLHYPTLKSLGLLNGTQLSRVSSHLVFNSYQIVTQKWYQTGLFRIILVIATVALSVVVPPAGAGLLGGGILGSNLALGTAIGITSATAAAIAGGVANALAAMVLTALIQKGSNKMFGAEAGAIIGTILSFVALTYGQQFALNGNFDVDWGSMLKADNLLKLTDSVANAYSAWTNVNITDIYAKINDLREQYGLKTQELLDQSSEILGMTDVEIDPMMFLNADDFGGSEDIMETPDQFFNRTLMTGETIAELSQVMVSEFADLSLELPSFTE